MADPTQEKAAPNETFTPPEPTTPHVASHRSLDVSFASAHSIAASPGYVEGASITIWLDSPHDLINQLPVYAKQQPYDGGPVRIPEQDKSSQWRTIQGACLMRYYVEEIANWVGSVSAGDCCGC